jgi:hypothetical protein
MSLLILLITTCAFAQPPLSLTYKRNNFFIDHETKAVCPGLDVEYKIDNWKHGAHKLDVINGDADGDVSADGKIKIFWYDTGDTCKVIVTPCDTCATAAPKRTFIIRVLSLKKTLPTITQDPPERLDVGFTHTIKFTVEAKYPFLGTEDDADESPFKLDYFYWEIPNNWTINTVPDDLPTITVTTDVGTGGNVTAQARNNACAVQEKSDTAFFDARRKMPSPCPVTSATQPYELCGESIQNTFNCAGLPLNFTSPPNGVTYEWSVSPADGWVKLGELDNTVKYKTDGQKSRTVKVKVTAYGVSDSCTLFVPLRLTNPATLVNGPETLCDEGNYKLTLPLPSGATSSWAITSLTPGFPVPVSPSTGTGTEANVSVGGGGALCRLAFTISGCGTSTILADTFFAGLPAIFDQRIDGLPGTQAFVCPGTHWASLKLQGADSSCVAWENSGNNPFFFSCLIGDVYMSGFNGSTSFIARALNVCGSADTRFFFMPKNWGCNGWGWGLTIYPNPAVGQVTVETTLEENSNLVEKPKMNGIRLINNSGGVAYESFHVGDSFTINLGGIPPGSYTLQTVVEGVPVSETVQIKLE